MNKYLILYHGEDNDGVFAGAIAYQYIKRNFPDAGIVEIGVNYNDMSEYDENDFTWWNDTYDSVIMLDISLPEKMMKKAWSILKNKFVWIDHHAPIIKSSLSNGFHEIPGERNTTKSALLLTWKFFFDPLFENEPPYILRVLSAWDSFTFELEGISKDFAYDVNTGVTDFYNLDFTGVCNFVAGILDNDSMSENVNFLHDHGHTINAYNKKRYENSVYNWGDWEWTVDGRPAIAMFMQEPTSSLVFESAITTDMKHGIVFKKNYDSWVVSLYNINDSETFHCGEYLKKKYKGGGHVGAAGCTLTNEQFLTILKDKSL